MKASVALTVAGLDPSGGAGIAADLRTFAAHGVHGAAVAAVLTVQDTRCVHRSEPVDADLVAAQIDTVLADLDVGAVKTGALGSAAVVAAIAERATAGALPRLVVDPVLVSSSGASLLAPEAIATLRHRLLPAALLATPNRREASTLAGPHLAPACRDEGAAPSTIAATRLDQPGIDEAVACAELLVEAGTAWVLVTGGDAGAGPDGHGEVVDVLAGRHPSSPEVLRHERVATTNDRGTGCTLSAAVAAGLAQGRPIRDAILEARRYTLAALERGAGRQLGSGRGPLGQLPNL